MVSKGCLDLARVVEAEKALGGLDTVAEGCKG